MTAPTTDRLAQPLTDLVLEDFTPHFDQLADRFEDHPRWRRLVELGTEPWLDSGDIEAIGRLWTRPFTAVTTNNTLLNREVQKGQYDELVRRAAALVRGRAGRKIDDRELVLEVAFVLNARHALRLVEAFDACVSVEEHTDLAHDADAAHRYARRYFAICPQRFYVKIPLTPAGLIAARRCHEESIPVNLTLGFSARMNYLAARFARPAFVNVFLGRLNSLVADNALGSGEMVGEKATLASQRAVADVRQAHARFKTRQIAASIRSGEQPVLLAGVDVMTLPISAADEFLRLDDPELTDRTDRDYDVQLNQGVKPSDVALDTLWDVPDELADACDALDGRDPFKLKPADLLGVLADHGVGDLLVDWSGGEVRASREEGKIPALKTWAEGLRAGRFGLDALMNLAGLNAFTADQDAMDARVRQVLGG